MVSGWWWILIVLALLAALAVTAVTGVLASMLLRSGSDRDRRVGAILIVAALGWLGLPAWGTWLVVRADLETWGAVVLGVSLTASIGAVRFVVGGIEAAARP